MRLTGAKNSLRFRSLKAAVLLVALFSLAAVSAWGAPQVSSLIPASIGQNAQGKTIAVYGSGFQCGMSVSFSDPAIASGSFNNLCASGVISTNVQFVTTNTTSQSNVSDNVFLQLTVPGALPAAGPLTLTFTNTDATQGTAILMVNTAPVIASASTNVANIYPGQTFTLTLNGSGFQNGAVLTASSSGITVNSLTVNSAGTLAEARVTTLSAAAPGAVDITLTNPDGGTAQFKSAFTVLWSFSGRAPALTVYEDPRLVGGVKIPFDLFWNNGWLSEGNILPPAGGGVYTPFGMILKAHPFLFQQVMGHIKNNSFEFQVWNQTSAGTGYSMGWTAPLTASSPSVFGHQNFDIAFESNTGNGLLVYGTSSGLFFQRLYQDTATCAASPLLTTAPCWGNPLQVTPVGAPFTGPYINRVRLASNPDPASNEILVAYQDNCQTTNGCAKLYIRTWTGSGFSSEISVSSATAYNNGMVFDINYTRATKTGMLAWVEYNTGTAKYCLWSSCPAASLTNQTGTTTTTNLYAVKLTPDPASDQMALTTLENSNPGKLKTQIWNGLSWPVGAYSSGSNPGGVYTISSSLLNISVAIDWQNFDLAWVNRPQNRLFAIYGYTDAVAGLYGGAGSQSWSPAGGWSGDAAIPGFPLDPAYGLYRPIFMNLRLDDDPQSGDLLAAFKSYLGSYASVSGLLGSQLFGVRWNSAASAWTDNRQQTTGDIFDFQDDYAGLSYYKNFPVIFSPTTIQNFTQGGTVSLNVQGTLFKSGAVLSFPGFVPTTMIVNTTTTPNTLTATGSVALTALPGIYDFTITNPDGSQAVGKNLIQISPSALNPPTIISVSPNFAAEGVSGVKVLLTGYNFPASFSVSFGTGITVSNPVLLSPTQVSLTLAIDPAATAGPNGGLRDIIITDLSTGTPYTSAGLFTVNFAPSITSVTPVSIIQGQTGVNMTITGSGIQPGSSVEIQDGANDLGWRNPGATVNTYPNGMTGNLFNISGTGNQVIYAILLETDNEAPNWSNSKTSVGIYDNNGGVPGNLKAFVSASISSSGVGLTAVTFLSGNPVLPPGNYWFLFNFNQLGIVLAHDNNQTACDNISSCVAVNKSNPYGTWPSTGGTAASWTTTGSFTTTTPPGRRYAVQVQYYPQATGTPITKVGSFTYTDPNGVNGFDSNQMTGTSFTTAMTAHISGLTAYINTVDPISQSGSMAIYADNSGAPGVLKAASSNQTLTAGAFNQFQIPPTTLPPGTYWVMINVNGPTTSLTYDTGTSTTSVIKATAFNNGWPLSGGTGWASSTGRRYALGVVGDINVTGSFDTSGTSITAILSADPGAYLGGRSVCIINQDGGKDCSGIIQVVAMPPANNAQETYGIAGSPLPVYRYWDGLTPWGNETAMAPGGLAAPPVWSVVRNYPNVGGRQNEKIYLGSDGGLLAAQVWNGTTWALSFTVNASSWNSRSFDASYEQATTVPTGNKALAVYGVPGSGIPQYKVWDGTAWSASAPVSGGASTDSVFWVRLESNPSWYPSPSHEILLAYLSGTINPDGTVTNANLHLQFWNGSAFSADTPFTAGSGNINLCQTCSLPVVGQLFDIAYENLTGLPLVAWGITNVETPTAIRWTGTNWSATAPNAAAPPGISLFYFKLASDPNSNRVALGTGSAGSVSITPNYNVQIWDESQQLWDVANKVNGLVVPGFVVSGNLLYSTAASDPWFDVGRNFDLAWEKNSGRLITVFGSDVSVNSCNFSDSGGFPLLTHVFYSTRYRVWDNVNGWSPDARVPNVGYDLVPRVIQLLPDRSSSDIFVNVTGHAANNFTYNNGNGPQCILATQGSSISNPANLQIHNYVWHNEGFNDKEAMTSSGSGAFQATDATTNPITTFTGFGDPAATGPSPDTLAPSAVTSLTVNSVYAGSVGLQWTASGDDGSAGRASSYIVAYSNTPILTDADFNAATQPPLVKAALPAFFSSSLTYTEAYAVTSLISGSTYCFAVKAKDRAGNLSPLSAPNPCVTTNGAGAIPPDAITDLRVVPNSLATNTGGIISVQLAWTAPSIPGYTQSHNPPLGEYDFRYSATPITDDVSFNAATPLIAQDGRNALFQPDPAGTPEFYDFVGLPAGTTYFAIKSCAAAAVDANTFRCSAAINPPFSAEVISPINTNSPVFVTTGAISLTPPSTISDLAVSGAAANSITLRWTAPGDTGNTGTAAGYDIRYSTSPIVPGTPATFLAATRVLTPPAPLPAGMVQSFAVTNLVSGSTVGVTYYFAIMTYGSSGLPSGISNVPAGTTLPVNDISPPAAITDLRIVPDATRSQSVVLNWTATGDNGTIGRATRYDLRYSPIPIVEDGTPITDPEKMVEFKNAIPVTGVPAPAPSGDLEIFNVMGLVSNTPYSFAIKAIDGAGNIAPLSTCLNCPGHTALYSGYNLVSVPYNIPAGSNDPTTVFGNDVTKPVTIYEWVNQAYSAPLTITDADGYFLFARGDFAVLKASDANGQQLGPVVTGPVTFPLQFGWNMVGEPYLSHPVYLQNVCVKKGNLPSVPFATAANNNWVNASIYSYDGSQYLAERYVDPLAINPPALMTSWKAYWFQVLLNDAGYSLIYLDSPGSCP